MKKIIIISLSILVVLSIMTVSILALTGNNSEDKNVDDIVIDDGIFSMSEFALNDGSAAKGEKMFMAAFNSFDRIIAQNDTIKIERLIVPNSYCKLGDVEFELDLSSNVKYFSNSFEVSDDKVLTASTKTETDGLKYMMFLSMLVTKYPDNVIAVDSYQDYSHSLAPYPYLLVSFDYEELGYDTIADYKKDLKNDEIQPGNNTFLVGYNGMSIMQCGVGDPNTRYSVGPNMIDTFLKKNNNVVE